MKESLPDYYTHEEFENRLSKLKSIKDLGMNPYPHSYSAKNNSLDLLTTYKEQAVGSSEEASQGISPKGSIAGRLVLFRAMGKNAFGHIQDDQGRIQVMFNKQETTISGLTDDRMQALKFLEKKVDLGDFLGLEGHLFRTQKGELTLFVKKVTLLCKTLLPLPDKHSGLKDKGTRYKKRWLDLIANKNSLETLKTRSLLIREIRKFFEQEKFIEVETPALQNIYGGAHARPFETTLHALHQQMFLRISPEISLKKLLVGGLTKIFEIGKVYRNEGIDRTHNPEFTMLEAYSAYADYNDMMQLTENLFSKLAQLLFNSTVIGTRQDKDGNEHLIDLKAPWKRLTMKESIALYANIEIDGLSNDELREKLSSKIDIKELKKKTRGELIAYLFENFVEQHLIQPHHITDHPIETTPLCKSIRKDAGTEEELVERFESFILGYEFCNAYSELNDPEKQRDLLTKQHQMRDLGDEEANPMDEEFLEAICQGMPPSGGLGIGIDRLVMLFTNQTSIRDVLYFPIVKGDD